ncbi:unnamed protein product [Meloidogyne enterolobii]|uniref:Uncharacterized protein n=1 Tax=Meloidogyne enterolobii TaxID=390850 RepID=A0ACB0YP70_MELEN
MTSFLLYLLTPSVFLGIYRYPITNYYISIIAYYIITDNLYKPLKKSHFCYINFCG